MFSLLCISSLSNITTMRMMTLHTNTCVIMNSHTLFFLCISFLNCWKPNLLNTHSWLRACFLFFLFSQYSDPAKILPYWFQCHMYSETMTLWETWSLISKEHSRTAKKFAREVLKWCGRIFFFFFLFEADRVLCSSRTCKRPLQPF